MERCENDVCGLDKYKQVVQLHDKDENSKEYPIFPVTYTHAVYDGKTGANLESMLAQFNNVFLQYQGTAKDTRLLLPKEMRRKGVQITYRNMDDEVVTEKCVNDSQSDNDHWGLDANWMRIDELSLQGDISVSKSGTWIINGADTGVKALGPKGDNGLTPWMKTIDNKLYYSYDNQTWKLSSDYIAAWFRFTGTSGSSQANNIGKIQISRDEGKTWADLSGTFTNNLHIKGYVATTSDLPSSAVQGDIYGVGPTYAESDTEHTNPIYHLHVKDINGWVDNGQFTSVAAGVVQELGESETEVMSQKAVKDTIHSTKQIFLADKSFSGRCNIAKNFLVNIGSEGEFLAYQASEKYDCAWINIVYDSGVISCIGAVPRFYAFFSSDEPSAESFLGIGLDGANIPSGTKLAILDLEREANEGNFPDYIDLKITYGGIGARKIDLENSENSLTGEFFTIKSSSLKEGGVVVSSVTGLDSTDFIPITGLSDIKVIGGWVNKDSSITCIAFYDKNKTFISSYLGDYHADGIYEFSLSEIPSGSKYIRCCANTLMYSNCSIRGIDLSSLLECIKNTEEEVNTVVEVQENVLRKQTLINITPISDITGYFIDSTGTPKANANFHYIRFDIDNSKSYKVSSAIGGNTTIRFVSYYKEDGTYLGHEYLVSTPSEGSYELVDQPLHIPEGTVYIYVNAALNRAVSLKEVEYGDYYDLSVLDNEVSKLMKVHIYGLTTDNDANLFYIRTSYNKTKDILILYKTNNNTLISPKTTYVGDKTLSDNSLMSSTYSVSEHPDSTAPLFNSSVYWHLFAQHGYVIPYITNSNGMTISDIGAIWKDQLDRQFVIGNVTSSSIYLLPVFDTSGGEGNDTRSWKTPTQTPINTLTHVSGGTTTTAITGTTQYTIQLRPIMKSYNRKMILDGKEVTEAGDYLCDEFQASESQIGYDPATVPQQNWFPTVGSIGVPNLEGALEMARFSWSYNFKGANCCVNTTIDIRRKVECQSYGACQQQFFLDKGNYKAMFLIPKLKPQSGIDPSKPFNSPSISSTGLSYQRNSTYLIDENDLVDRQIGYLYDEDAGDYLVGMAAGLSLVSGDTVKEKRIQNIAIGTGNVHERLGSFSPSNTNKFYIAAVNTAPFADDGYNFPNTYFKEINYYVSYFDPTENVGQVYWYKDGSQYIVYAHCQTEQDRVALKLPYFMEGLGVEVVEKTDGATLLSSTIQNGSLYVSYDNNANYIVLKTRN